MISQNMIFLWAETEHLKGHPVGYIFVIMFMFTLLYTLHLYSNVYFLASTFSIHSVFFVLLLSIKRSYLFCTMILKINSFRKKSLRCFSLQKLILVQLSLKHLIKKRWTKIEWFFIGKIHLKLPFVLSFIIT